MRKHTVTNLPKNILCQLWHFVLLQLLVMPAVTFAQSPANDNYAKAEKINISQNGYGKGSFLTNKVNLTKATKEAGESFHLLQYYAGTDKKTVWFVFETRQRRSVSIELWQKDTMIAQDAVGLTVYRTKSKSQPPNLGEVEGTLTPISKFGSTTNTCLTPDVYYIQVSAKQNANDEIWINLVVDDASPAPYDYPQTSYDFGVLGGSKELNFESGCQGIEDTTELKKHLGKDFNQTAWFTFTTDNYSDMLAVTSNINRKLTGPDTATVGYFLYKGNAKNGLGNLSIVDSALMSVACNPYNPQYCGLLGMRRYFCKLEANTTYTIQLFFHKYSVYDFSLRIDEQGEQLSKSANPNNLPAAYKIKLPATGGSGSTQDWFACNSRMSDNLCGKVNVNYLIDTPYISNNIPHIDTFDLSLWATFEVPVKGRVSIDTRISTCQNYPYYGARHYFRIFKGDVTKSCDLTPFRKYSTQGGSIYENLCLEPGVYSFQLLGSVLKRPVSNVCYESVLGKQYTTNINFWPEVKQQQAKHYRTDSSYNMGDITSQLKSGTGEFAPPDYFKSPDTSYMIDGRNYAGRLVFRRFYISEPLHITMKEEAVPGYSLNNASYLFSGDISLGIDTLRHLDLSLFGSNYFNERVHYTTICTPLPAGWYTVASVAGAQCATATFANRIFINGTRVPKRRFNRPHKAHIYNNGNALYYHNNPAPGNRTAVQFTFPDDSLGCELDTPFSAHPLQDCLIRNGAEYYNRTSYYVFRLDNESFVRISGILHSGDGRPQSTTMFQLYKGNAAHDSLSFNDPAKLMQPCHTSGEYCRLQPGQYTIVFFSNVKMLLRPTVRVDKSGFSKFDHNANAGDVGFVKGDNKEILSAQDNFFCTTGAFSTDPDTNLNHFYYPNKLASSVPYPMPHNFRMTNTSNYGGRKNIWYTFTVKGTGDVTVNLYPRIKDDENSLYYISVYRSDEKGNISFADLKSAGKTDSTFAQGLQFVVNNYNPYLAVNNVKFGKLGCDSARYYVVIDWVGGHSRPLNTLVQLGVKYNEYGVYGQKGDFCSNAEEVNLHTAGTAKGELLINCHTKGESYGEDGSNMACLIPENMAFKTSWFKFKYSGNQKVDLSFKITENSTANPTQIRYRVLYGTCNAMTGGPCVENSLSSFKLDCMGAGEYYVQVVTPADATGNISLEATATPTVYQVCKPVNLLGPVANFSFTGGCNNAPVKFINLSTAGSDIEYLWDFGNGKTSAEKAPTIQYNPVKSIDTFYVTLWVTNTYNLFRDSLIIPVLVFKDPVKVILEKKYFELNCSEKVKFKASSNYGFATYEWFPKEGLDNPYSAEPTFTSGAKDAVYKVRVKAENCVVEDSVHIYMRPKMLAFGDTVICPGSKSVLSAPNGYDYYYWSTNRYGQTLEITEPGKYWVTGYTFNGCSATDTIIVQSGSNIGLSLGKDTAICPGQKFLLTPNKTGIKYKWSTGDTTAYIWVDKPGKYWLQLHDNLCQGADTVEISQLEAPKEEIEDEIIMCDNKPVTVSIYNTGQKYLWSTGSTADKEIFTKPGKYWVTTSNNQCQRTDTFTVKSVELPTVNLGKDTAFCGDFVLWLDAGEGAKYHWQPVNYTERKILANQYGRYTVKVFNEEGCENTAGININEECDPQLWVPNAFTPGNDSTNNIFKAVGQHITEFELNIYNRWGEHLFRSTDINIGWDGHFQKTPCQMDAYIWTISYRGKYVFKNLNGIVYLLR